MSVRQIHTTLALQKSLSSGTNSSSARISSLVNVTSRCPASLIAAPFATRKRWKYPGSLPHSSESETAERADGGGTATDADSWFCVSIIVSGLRGRAPVAVPHLVVL